MSTSSRNRLTLTVALWGLSLALLSAALAFDGLALSPLLLAALSAFLYTLVGGLLSGPLLEPAASKEKERVR